jgi:uncharacterized protein YqfB (UPF0267 family)
MAAQIVQQLQQGTAALAAVAEHLDYKQRLQEQDLKVTTAALTAVSLDHLTRQAAVAEQAQLAEMRQAIASLA